MQNQQGKIIQLECEVQFHFFTPIIQTDDETGEKTQCTKYMAVISYGQHTHPPPPPIRIPHHIKEELVQAVRQFGSLSDITARRLIASPIYSILTNGKPDLDSDHIALYNFDAVNNLLRKEKLKEFPWGTDLAGVQYLQYSQGDNNPYIRSIEHYWDGQFIIVCQFQEQSGLFLPM